MSHGTNAPCPFPSAWSVTQAMDEGLINMVMSLVMGFHIKGKSPEGCESEAELCVCYMV